MLTAGIILPAGVGAEPQPILVDGTESINKLVGGWFDAVRKEVALSDSLHGVLVGYIHDEGLILDLDMNYLASAVFGQELRGDCVLVWGNNADGDYDGDDHDIPTELSKFVMEDLPVQVANIYNESVMHQIVIALAIKSGDLTKKDYDKMQDYLQDAIESGEMCEEGFEIMNRAYDALEKNLSDSVADMFKSNRGRFNRD
jgi:hypothetical protein